MVLLLDVLPLSYHDRDNSVVIHLAHWYVLTIQPSITKNKCIIDLLIFWFTYYSFYCTCHIPRLPVWLMTQMAALWSVAPHPIVLLTMHSAVYFTTGRCLTLICPATSRLPINGSAAGYVTSQFIIGHPVAAWSAMAHHRLARRPYSRYRLYHRPSYRLLFHRRPSCYQCSYHWLSFGQIP